LATDIHGMNAVNHCFALGIPVFKRQGSRVRTLYRPPFKTLRLLENMRQFERAQRPSAHLLSAWISAISKPYAHPYSTQNQWFCAGLCKFVQTVCGGGRSAPRHYLE